MSSGFQQVLTLLLAAVVVVPIAKKLGLGAVLGYLVAGVIIGPPGLGLIDGNDGVAHLAELGVILMLFLIGLELKPSLLLQLKVPIFVWGGLQVVVTTALMTAVAYAFSHSWVLSLALGMTASLSSTAIVIQTLQEKGLFKSAAGQSAFSILLFQDIAVIPMLAIFPWLASDSGASTDLAATQSVQSMHGASVSPWAILGAIMGVVLMGRVLVRPWFRFIGKMELREIFTASALLLVLSITALMQRVGLSPALGAFLAGVVLADSEYRHQIEVDIEPFKGLLLGLFFITVGSQIDFASISSQPLWIAVMVLSLIAVKFAVGYGIGKFQKLPSTEAWILGASLAQGGEFAFVLIGFGTSLGIMGGFGPQVLAEVAISMAIAPLLIGATVRWIVPWASGCAPESLREPDQIPEENHPIIVAGVGRFGQTVIRLLRACGFGVTVLDFDADQVEVMRKFGTQSYFGDASRLDLLQAAGIARAKLLILAIDDKEKTIEIIKMVKANYPQLHILARAYDRIHLYEIMSLGVEDVFVETSGTAQNLAVRALERVGYGKRRSYRAGQLFKRANDQSILDMAKIWDDADEETFRTAARTWVDELEKILQADGAEINSQEKDLGWKI